MTQLLVSVRNASEAAQVAPFRPGIIDLKEPNAGSLGRASIQVADEVGAAVSPTQICSVALGELSDGLRDGLLCDLKAIPTAFRYAKVGLAGALNIPNWPELWRKFQMTLPDAINHVAVAYLDHAFCNAPDVSLVIERAIEFNCSAVLLDTFDKSRGSFNQVQNIRQVADWLAEIERANMLSVLAGSVNLSNLNTALELKPDFVGVRGAVCDSERTGPISTARLKQFLETFHSSVRLMN